MKAPPKRKGNYAVAWGVLKSGAPSMKAPPKRKGNGLLRGENCFQCAPSMKAPPKRKGNTVLRLIPYSDIYTLNESPSEKEGKYPITTSSGEVLIDPQ